MSSHHTDYILVLYVVGGSDRRGDHALYAVIIGCRYTIGTNLD